VTWNGDGEAVTDRAVTDGTVTGEAVTGEAVTDGTVTGEAVTGEGVTRTLPMQGEARRRPRAAFRAGALRDAAVFADPEKLDRSAVDEFMNLFT
jgi:hypothetical protein